MVVSGAVFAASCGSVFVSGIALDSQLLPGLVRAGDDVLRGFAQGVMNFKYGGGCVRGADFSSSIVGTQAMVPSPGHRCLVFFAVVVMQMGGADQWL